MYQKSYTHREEREKHKILTVSMQTKQTPFFYFVIAPKILHNCPAFNFMGYLATSYMLRDIAAAHHKENAGKQRADPTCDHICATLKIITKNGWA